MIHYGAVFLIAMATTSQPTSRPASQPAASQPGVDYPIRDYGYYKELREARSNRIARWDFSSEERQLRIAAVYYRHGRNKSGRAALEKCIQTEQKHRLAHWRDRRRFLGMVREFVLSLPAENEIRPWVETHIAESRRDQKYGAFDLAGYAIDLTDEQWTACMQGRPRVGMTYIEVMFAAFVPDETHVDGDLTSLIYDIGDWTGTVTIQEGKVVDVADRLRGHPRLP